MQDIDPCRHLSVIHQPAQVKGVTATFHKNWGLVLHDSKRHSSEIAIRHFETFEIDWQAFGHA